MITRWKICRCTNRGLFGAAWNSHRIRPTAKYSSSTGSSVEDISNLLSKPTWSVRSLLPPADSSATPDITSKQLHHLLRLSALPPPKDAAEEKEMLQTLQSQLHFVKKIQSVNTDGLKPLQSIHDETAAARIKNEVTYEDLAEVIDKEERAAGGRLIVKNRRKEPVKPNVAEEWDVLGQASRTARKYFIVKSSAVKE